jgi:hypothetical protein
MPYLFFGEKTQCHELHDTAAILDADAICDGDNCRMMMLLRERIDARKLMMVGRSMAHMYESRDKQM